MKKILAIISIILGFLFLLTGASYYPIFKNLLPLSLSVLGLGLFVNNRGLKTFNLGYIGLGLLMTLVSFFAYPSPELYMIFAGLTITYSGIYALVASKKEKKALESLDDTYLKLSGQEKYQAKDLDERWQEIIKDSDWSFDDLENIEALDKKVQDMEKESQKIKEDSNKKEIPKEEYKEKTFFEKNAQEKIREKNIKSKGNNGFLFTSEDYISKNNLLATNKEVVISDHFAGGKINSILSDYWIDLSKTSPHSSDIRLSVNCFLSSVKIRVPENWIIYMTGNTALGETSLPKTSPVNPDHKLYIKNNVVLGDLKIEYKHKNENYQNK